MLSSISALSIHENSNSERVEAIWPLETSKCRDTCLPWQGPFWVCSVLLWEGMRVQGLSSPQARIFVLRAAGFPSRISCSSNELCFDSSTAACQELLPVQPVCLCICKGVCRAAALILTPFLVPSFIQSFKTKWEGETKGQTRPVWPSSLLWKHSSLQGQWGGAGSLAVSSWESTAARLIHFRNEPWLIGQIFPIYQLLPTPG